METILFLISTLSIIFVGSSIFRILSLLLLMVNNLDDKKNYIIEIRTVLIVLAISLAVASGSITGIVTKYF